MVDFTLQIIITVLHKLPTLAFASCMSREGLMMLINELSRKDLTHLKLPGQRGTTMVLMPNSLSYFYMNLFLTSYSAY